MSLALSSPITGTAQTGLTLPTYTLTTDTAPTVGDRQYAVTALGGTQTGADAHSAARPFTITTVRPKVFKTLGSLNPVTGRLPGVPKNKYGVLVRKGVTPLAGQPSEVAFIRIEVDVPAGSDLADPINLRAMISAGFGALSQMSSGFGDTVITNIV